MLLLKDFPPYRKDLRFNYLKKTTLKIKKPTLHSP